MPTGAKPTTTTAAAIFSTALSTQHERSGKTISIHCFDAGGTENPDDKKTPGHMSISPFFLNLRSAYRSEIDDLTFDSDGRDVLRQRLAEKRREIGFLVQMMELSPEMVAVIFHQGFAFSQPAVMDHLLTHEPEEFPQWSHVSDCMELAPWAQELAQVVLQAAGGERFLTVAAGLHYMAGKADALAMQHGNEEAGDEDADENDNDDQDEFDADENGDEPGDARARKEAAADWLVGQGFDRKD